MKEPIDYKSHWNRVYQTKEANQLGWFEDNPETTLKLIAQCNLNPDATILNVGVGTSTLIDSLVDKGFENIIANDLSDIALQKLEGHIYKTYNHRLHCIVDDLTNPKALSRLENVDLWIDRAVLHFFVDKNDHQAYFNLIKKIVSKTGYVLIAVFALDGAETCSNLPIQRYDAKMLQSQLGPSFTLIHAFHQVYINPFGDERPYIFTLFQRQ